MRARLAATLVALLALLFAYPAPAQAARVVPGSNWYGWNWDHTVTVYDGTGSARWDVAGAVAKWSVQGLTVRVTTDLWPTPDIVVRTGDMQTVCASGQDTIIGCGDTVVVAGEPVHGTVWMNEDYATWIYGGLLVGGTLHELGHTLGFGHPPLSNADSVMGVPIPYNNTARTTLSSFDRGGVRVAYKRNL